MNNIMELLLKRKSVRAYERRKISKDIKAKIFKAMLRAPTAGNMMLYSVIEVKERKIKNILVKTCDNQPFIAKAPLVLIFLADYQRWFDYFAVSGVEQFCEQKKITARDPEEGDLFMACCDALIAAQTAVIAAESFGIGSCYIGDIMESYEVHKKLFNLPKYVFPICLLCFGYPTKRQRERKRPGRFDEEFIIFENQYKKLGEKDFEKMFRDWRSVQKGVNVGQMMYLKKFIASFAIERNRSVREILKVWRS